MKQILQSIKTGCTEIADVPVPKPSRGSLLIKTSKTLVSSGTERMLVDFGKASMFNKARKQPDKVKLVLQKMKTDGIKPTIDSVLDKLDKPLPLGYCNAGQVVAIGSGVTEFSVGDRVVSNGNHAEFVNVPVNLCAKIPDNLSYEEASFTVIGAIALQGVRLVKPTLGETVVVIGLGLVGLMAVQLLQANGCHVIGIDKNPKRLLLAKNFGADVLNSSLHKNEIQILNSLSGGEGVDAVLVAAASQSNELMHQAASMCRQRGRIILVGSVGLELSRDDFFKKELTFQVSSSYGPGRYDQNYEEKGFDYPIGFVRWTEKRNFQAILDIMGKGKLNISSLISHRFLIEDSIKAYDLISSGQPSLGILLSYNGKKIDRSSRVITTIKKPYTHKEGQLKNTVSFIGSGNYATSTLIPAFKSAGVKLKSICSASGVSGLHAARKFGFHETTSDLNEILNDKEVQTIVIATRHDTHAELIIECLKKGKHVFVEKPLCLDIRELEKIRRIEKKSSSILMVGFNRRFSPHIKEIKKNLSNSSGPKSMIVTINAGALPNDHWVHDHDIGGGRIIGEVCHFVDLLRFLSGVPIKRFQKFEMKATNKDTLTLNLNFSDGSLGTIHYFSNGSRLYPKERLEIFANGSILCLDNFRKLTGYGWPGFNKMKLWKQNKGQSDCVKEFLNAIKGGNPSPIPIEEIIEVSRVTIEASY